jgi:hypothetical protein
VLVQQCVHAPPQYLASCADPAAEEFKYEPSCDIKDLVTLEDVMDECELGPNGCVPCTPRMPCACAAGDCDPSFSSPTRCIHIRDSLRFFTVTGKWS